MNADQILEQAANTFRKKNKIYGDNYKRVGECLAAMFPHGLELKTADDHNRFQIFNLILVKLSRYAVNWKSGHIDSIHDAMVYCAMLEDIDSPQRQQQNFDWGYKSQAKLEEGEKARVSSAI